MNKSKEERTEKKRQNKEAKESQKERQEGRKKRRRERDRERELEKKGRPKERLRRNKGRHSKINQKGPFLGGNTGFFLLKAKKGKEKKNTKQEINKEGLVPSEVALWATSPDP